MTHRPADLIRTLIAVLLLGWSSLAQAQPPDLIITGGQLVNSSTPNATALAVRGDRIVAVGSDHEIQALATSNTRRIDAQGASVTPGLHDAHVHFLSGSLSLAQVNLSDCQSIADIEATIQKYMAQNPSKPVIVGRGWLYGTFPGGLPDKAILDRLIPDAPAIMRCYDGHTVWVNSKALAAAGITRDTPDPPAGIIVRDAQGEATGVLKEAAQSLIDKVIPEPTRDEKLAALRQGIALAHTLGVTSVCEAGVGLAELELFESLRAGGELNLRMAIALEGRPDMLDTDIDRLDQLRARFPQLDIRAVKLYVDGVIESHTAALLQPYANRPTQGLLETTPAQLNEVVRELDKRGWQIMVHAIGDGGIRMTLDALELAAKTNPVPQAGRRHRLEHIESISSEDIARFGRLGIIASMQPYHANPNSNIFNVWAANLGEDRASRAWVWKSISDAGGQLAFGSDWPVVDLDPRLGMHTAITRQTLDGQPPGGFVPAQRLPLPQVLKAYTSGAAYAQFAEQQHGSLIAGMLADIAVWDRDLFDPDLALENLHHAKVVRTIYGGE